MNTTKGRMLAAALMIVPSLPPPIDGLLGVSPLCPVVARACSLNSDTLALGPLSSLHAVLHRRPAISTLEKQTIKGLTKGSDVTLANGDALISKWMGAALKVRHSNDFGSLLSELNPHFVLGVYDPASLANTERFLRLFPVLSPHILVVYSGHSNERQLLLQRLPQLRTDQLISASKETRQIAFLKDEGSLIHPLGPVLRVTFGVTNAQEPDDQLIISRSTLLAAPDVGPVTAENRFWAENHFGIEHPSDRSVLVLYGVSADQRQAIESALLGMGTRFRPQTIWLPSAFAHLPGVVSIRTVNVQGPDVERSTLGVADWVFLGDQADPLLAAHLAASALLVHLRSSSWGMPEAFALMDRHGVSLQIDSLNQLTNVLVMSPEQRRLWQTAKRQALDQIQQTFKDPEIKNVLEAFLVQTLVGIRQRAGGVRPGHKVFKVTGILFGVFLIAGLVSGAVPLATFPAGQHWPTVHTIAALMTIPFLAGAIIGPGDGLPPDPEFSAALLELWNDHSGARLSRILKDGALPRLLRRRLEENGLLDESFPSVASFEKELGDRLGMSAKVAVLALQDISKAMESGLVLQKEKGAGLQGFNEKVVRIDGHPPRRLIGRTLRYDPFQGGYYERFEVQWEKGTRVFDSPPSKIVFTNEPANADEKKEAVITPATSSSGSSARLTLEDVLADWYAAKVRGEHLVHDENASIWKWVSGVGEILAKVKVDGATPNAPITLRPTITSTRVSFTAFTSLWINLMLELHATETQSRGAWAQLFLVLPPSISWANSRAALGLFTSKAMHLNKENQRVWMIEPNWHWFSLVPPTTSTLRSAA